MSYNPPGPDWQQNPGGQQGSWGNQQPQDAWPQAPQPGVPFGQQPNYGVQQYPEQSQSGVALGLGITGLVSFCICGPLLMPFLGAAAWYFGSVEKKAIARGLRNPQGLGQANTGMIMGIVSLAIGVLLVLAYLLLIFASAASSP